MNNSDYIAKDNQKEIDFQCPICKKHHIVTISLEELQKAKFQLKLVQKAYGHEDFGQVIILHIDWESRIRRVTAYNFLDNIKPTMDESEKSTNSFMRNTFNQIHEKLSNTNEINKTMSLNLIKPWKATGSESPTVSLDKLISAMVKSSKSRKFL